MFSLRLSRPFIPVLVSLICGMSVHFYPSESSAAPIVGSRCELLFVSETKLATARQASAETNYMRLPPEAPETRHFHRARAFWEKMIGKRPFDASTEKRLGSLLAHREFKEWFYFKNQMLDGIENNNPSAYGMSKIIKTPQEGLLAKLMAIRQAKYTIDLTYYIFNKDESGRAILHELKEALRRGVNVRYMEDGLGTPSLTRAEAKALIDFAEGNAGYMLNERGEKTNIRAKFEYVVFNPITSLPSDTLGNIGRFFLKLAMRISGRTDIMPYNVLNMNRRSHDKLVLVDGAFPDLAVGIMGGANVGNHYTGLPQTDENTYRDIEIVFRNAPGASLIADRNQDVGAFTSDYYHRIYSNLGNRQIKRGMLGLWFGYKKYEEKLEQSWNTVSLITKEEQARLDEDMASPEFGQKYLTTGFETGDLDLVHTLHNLVRDRAMREYERNDLSQKLKNRNGILAHLRDAMKAEQKEITIVSPYLWFTPGQILLLKKWLLQDPNRKLTIITNSVLTSDNMLAQALVDQVMAPAFVFDPGLRAKDGSLIRRSVAPQVKIYEYGRLDSNELGGTKPYGKLHMKLVHLASKITTLITTFNGDPRSQLLNSEGGLLVSGSQTVDEGTQKVIATLISESHEWGSDEFHAIRAHAQLPALKRAIVERQRELNWLLHKLNLWWTI